MPEQRRSRNLIGSVPTKDCTKEQLIKAFEGYSYLFSREVGTLKGFDHWQYVVKTKNSSNGAALKRTLPPSAHVEVGVKPLKSLISYILKGGPDTIEYYGSDDLLKIAGLETKAKGKRLNKKAKIKEAVLSGKRFNEIISTMDEADGLEGFTRAFIQRQDELNYGGLKKRSLNVHYIYSNQPSELKEFVQDSLSGKFYSVTDFFNPWDFYEAEPTLIMDYGFEKCGLEDITRWLKRDATILRRRGEDRWAAYDRVFLIETRPPERLFRLEREDRPELLSLFYSQLTSVEKVGGGAIEPDLNFPTLIDGLPNCRFRDGVSFTDSLKLD